MRGEGEDALANDERLSFVCCGGVNGDDGGISTTGGEGVRCSILPLRMADGAVSASTNSKCSGVLPFQCRRRLTVVERQTDSMSELGGSNARIVCFKLSEKKSMRES